MTNNVRNDKAYTATDPTEVKKTNHMKNNLIPIVLRS